MAEEFGLTIAGVGIIDSWVYEITPVRHVFIVSDGTVYTGGEELSAPASTRSWGCSRTTRYRTYPMPEPYQATIARWRRRHQAWSDLHSVPATPTTLRQPIPADVGIVGATAPRVARVFGEMMRGAGRPAWPEATLVEPGGSFPVAISVPDPQRQHPMKVAVHSSGRLFSPSYGSAEASAGSVAWLLQHFPPPGNVEVLLHEWGDNPRVTAAITAHELLARGP